MRKVAAMRHGRDVLDVLSLINQSTVDSSVFGKSVSVPPIAEEIPDTRG
jgi:hypothetical protein